MDYNSRLLDPITKAKAIYTIEENSTEAARHLALMEELLSELPRYAEEAREARLTLLHIANRQTSVLDSLRGLLCWVLVALIILIALKVYAR